ncbi:hypothetical protein FDF97_19220 [Clostridium botulinum]|uniref:Uncharacterized protein n=2 Tax=Clostridium botulinum TaxID=1491 RepID=A0A077K226_CLOBO|nr:hypothetical protein [Clostridium botulinum]KEI83957.1 hypothetical protein N493_18750 [Clostridium botulinum B2 433]KIS21788.1 hypothetical protein N495_19640 [Clostridium botulinum B2 450]NFI09715.1 hypothetical protein [Clostridium botulinum]NFI23447.1 hypothetical protein [Clostridium botulinum]NFQ80290.1 hypothetical protein [Clostridium botulinum]
MNNFYFKIHNLPSLNKTIYIKMEYKNVIYSNYEVIKLLYIDMLSKQLRCNKEDIIPISKKKYVNSIKCC